MRLGILGTGAVGKTLAAQLDGMGHEVMVGTRDADETMSRTDPDQYGNPPFSAWQREHPGVELGTFAEAEHTVFVCGDDAEAKAKVTELLRAFGWTDILDLGDISAARGTEMVLPIWLRLFGALQKPVFNFKIVR